MTTADVLAELRRILADLTGSQIPLKASPQTPLLRDGIALDSLGATVLLTRVHSRYGVDVASEDLNLDALETMETLAEFIASRRR